MTPEQRKRWKPVKCTLEPHTVNAREVKAWCFQPGNLDHWIGFIREMNEGVFHVSCRAPDGLGYQLTVTGALVAGAIDEAEQTLRDLGWQIGVKS